MSNTTMAIDTQKLTVTHARAAFENGAFSPSELTETYLAAIAKRNPALNAYLEVFESARTDAKRAEERIAEGKGGPLTGIPIAIKDNLLIEGQRASASSKMLEGYRATYDATVIAKLKAAGAVLIGRTNMDEFAMGGSTENSAFGVTKNPFDESRVAGGSSGGSAVAVAADIAMASLGSDTGGLVRQAAAFC